MIFWIQVYVLIGLVFFFWSLTDRDVVMSLNSIDPRWVAYLAGAGLSMTIWPYYICSFIKMRIK